MPSFVSAARLHRPWGHARQLMAWVTQTAPLQLRAMILVPLVLQLASLDEVIFVLLMCSRMLSPWATMPVLALLLLDEGIFALIHIQSPSPEEVIFAMISTRSLSSD